MTYFTEQTVLRVW